MKRIKKYMRRNSTPVGNILAAFVSVAGRRAGRITNKQSEPTIHEGKKDS
jgi:hypothetical protein